MVSVDSLTEAIYNGISYSKSYDQYTAAKKPSGQ